MQARLQKILRDHLGISRRSAEELISKKKIKINGKIAELGCVVDTSKDRIEYKNKTLDPKKEIKLVYIVLNKPAGYLTSRFDPHHTQTVYDLLPKEFDYLFPVGRLDQDTEGLLLLTNDGDLTYKLTHPKYEVEKEYYVKLEGKLKQTDVKEIEKGLTLPNMKTSSAKIKTIKPKNGESELYITIHEGQNREIRRIFGHFHYSVTYLKRIRLQNLTLNDLGPGKWRYLTDKEVHSLQQSTAF